MRVLTGIQPSGKLHIGNYFGAIKPMLELQESSDLFIFIANYHALSSLHDGETLKQNSLDAAIAFLSLGIDPERSTFWLQSDVKEVLELYWILSAFTPVGMLERAHSYKDKIAKGLSPNHALFAYPVLMAADILLYDANLVPVGKDQKQHIEITRDITLKFNNNYGEILTLPEFKIDEELATIPGIDGAKMSKSYNNTIEIFTTPKALKKRCGKIVTDSTPLEEPKDYRNCNVFALYKLFANEDEIEEMKQRYQSGKEGYGHFKVSLSEKIWEFFAEANERRSYYEAHIDEVKDILSEGAKKARAVAKEKMEIIRDKVGILEERR